MVNEAGKSTPPPRRMEAGEGLLSPESHAGTQTQDVDGEIYRYFYEAAPLAFVIWDRACSITDWNRHAEQMFGWSRDEVLGRNFFEFLIPSHARPRVEHVVATLLHRALPSRNINENLTKSGDVILCEWNNSIRYDAEGRVVGAMSIGLDITGKKRAEEALRESEERLSLIANNLPVLIGYVDADQTYRFANREYTKWFGLAPSEIVGKKVKDVLGDAGYDQVRSNLTKVLSGRHVKYEGALPVIDGGRRPFLARYVPHRSKGGTIHGFFVLVEDITERKSAEHVLRRAHVELERRVEERTAELITANATLERQIAERRRIESELRNSENKYRALIDEASDAIVICDTEGNILDVNRKAVSLFGYSKQELMQRRFSDLHPASEMETYASAFHDVVRVGSGALNDGLIVTKKGERVPVDVTGSVVHMGEKVVVQGLFRDITERKRAEEVVRNIAEGVAASTGEAFFQSLVGQLAKMLNMDYAFVGELSEEGGESVSTIAVWARDRVVDNFRYELAHTPCENVVGKVLCCYPRGVQQQFPKDELLKDMDVDCYVGVPLFDSKNQPLGLIAILDGEPLSNPRFVESTLRVFAARASAELERKRAEEALSWSEKSLRFLSAELLEAQEKERARIARELHDGIGQSLGTLKMTVETLLRHRVSGGEADAKKLSDLVPAIQTIMEEVRNTSMALRPSTLDTLGILATINWFCRECQNTYRSIQIEKEITLQEREIPDRLKTVIYRILQEAMNNVAKHSRASSVRISLVGRENRIELSIEDNGRGFDLSEAKDVLAGFGLTSLRERTDLSGGAFSMKSQPGKGTRVRASWPIQEG